jgi:hypothetical protein
MDELAARFDALDGITGFGYPADSVAPPAAIVTYPDTIDFDKSGARGADSMIIPAVLLFGRVSDRASRDTLSRWLDRAGTKRYRTEKTTELTKQTFSVDGANNSTVAINPATAPGPYLQFTLTAGVQGASNLRDIYVRSELVATDFHARFTTDPPFFGDPDAGGPLNAINPQAGVGLRYQRDTKQRAVVVWQNVTFLTTGILVGVWQANLDGTGFANRQYPILFPAPLGLSLPWTAEARLRGKIVDVRYWNPGQAVPGWKDPNQARSLNLDTDCGDSVAIPTPVGSGQAGWIAAHLGTDTSPPSMVRYRLPDSYLEADSTSLKDYIESGTYSSFDSVRVMSGEFDVVARGGVDYLAVALALDIIGNGRE